MRSARSVAVSFLLAVDRGRHVDSLTRDRNFKALGDRDRRLTTRLVYGVLRNRLRLDYFAGKLLRKALSALDPEVLWILRVGLYQLEFLRIPDRAAVHETVELCRHFRKSSARGLVNAVLRSFSRETPELPPGTDAPGLSVVYSHPEWLVRRFLRRYGPGTTRSLLARNNEEIEPALWVNPCKTTLEEVQRVLIGQGIEHELVDGPIRCLRVPSSFALHPLYRQGHCFFMDCASQEVAVRTKVEGCQVVGDFCAAPGGKSFLLSPRLDDGAILCCSDIDFRRVGAMRERAELYGIRSLQYFLCDWTQPGPVRKVFDSVLLDVPCSGLGTLRSNPDIRWRIVETDLPAYQKVQLSILRSAFRALKPGGELLYSTCSTEPEENEEVVEQFLAGEERAQLVGGYWRTFPRPYPGDCFFAARIRHLS